MTKAGSDHLKDQARRTAARQRRRYPDVLAELRRTPRTAPRPTSTELVLVCSGTSPWNRCARAAGHRTLDGGWGWCGWDHNDAVQVWVGYYDAESQAQRQHEDARRAVLTPEERAAEDAEAEAAYYADMADAGREPYDRNEDKYAELVDELRDEAREPDEDVSDRDYFLYGDDAYDDEDEYEVTF